MIDPEISNCELYISLINDPPTCIGQISGSSKVIPFKKTRHLTFHSSRSFNHQQMLLIFEAKKAQYKFSSQIDLTKIIQSIPQNDSSIIQESTTNLVTDGGRVGGEIIAKLTISMSFLSPRKLSKSYSLNSNQIHNSHFNPSNALIQEISKLSSPKRVKVALDFSPKQEKESKKPKLDLLFEDSDMMSSDVSFKSNSSSKQKSKSKQDKFTQDQPNKDENLDSTQKSMDPHMNSGSVTLPMTSAQITDISEVKKPDNEVEVKNDIKTPSEDKAEPIPTPEIFDDGKKDPPSISTPPRTTTPDAPRKSSSSDLLQQDVRKPISWKKGKAPDFISSSSNARQSPSSSASQESYDLKPQKKKTKTKQKDGPRVGFDLSGINMPNPQLPSVAEQEEPVKDETTQNEQPATQTPIVPPLNLDSPIVASPIQKLDEPSDNDDSVLVDTIELQEEKSKSEEEKKQPEQEIVPNKEEEATKKSDDEPSMLSSSSSSSSSAKPVHISSSSSSSEVEEVTKEEPIVVQQPENNNDKPESSDTKNDIPLDNHETKKDEENQETLKLSETLDDDFTKTAEDLSQSSNSSSSSSSEEIVVDYVRPETEIEEEKVVNDSPPKDEEQKTCVVIPEENNKNENEIKPEVSIEPEPEPKPEKPKTEEKKDDKKESESSESEEDDDDDDFF